MGSEHCKWNTKLNEALPVVELTYSVQGAENQSVSLVHATSAVHFFLTADLAGEV